MGGHVSCSAECFNGVICSSSSEQGSDSRYTKHMLEIVLFYALLSVARYRIVIFLFCCLHSAAS